MGPPDGPPLVLLEHPPEPPGALNPLAVALASTFRILLPQRAPQDPPGFGPLADALAADLGDALLTRATFVGAGFGGAVAAHLAARYPQLARALVLLNTVYPGVHNVERELAAALGRAFTYIPEILDPAFSEPGSPAGPALLRRLWAAGGPLPPGWERLAGDADLRARIASVYKANFEWRAGVGPFTAAEASAASALGSPSPKVVAGQPRHVVAPLDDGRPALVTIPTLYLFAGRPALPERIHDPKVLRRFASALTVERWPDAPTSSLFTDPSPFAARIRSFIEEVDLKAHLAEEAPPDRAQDKRDSRFIVQAYDKKIREFRCPHIQGGEAALRGSHPKTHGVAFGSFVVREDLPEPLRVGLFARPGERYEAALRFSSLGKPQLLTFHDRDPDIRGVGLKIFRRGADGAMETVQDVLVNTSPVLTTKNGRDVVPQNLDFLKLDHMLGYADELDVDDVLKASYYSQTPYRFGPGRAVKYRIRPRPLPPGADGGGVDRDRWDFLRARLAAALAGAEADVVLDLMVQFQRDPVLDPIEDPRVEWGGEYVAVAEIRLPPQAINLPEHAARDEALSFHLYHCLPEHAPLGAVNRSRRAVYDSSPALRRGLNHAPRPQERWEKPRRRVCVVGSGAAGLSAALALAEAGHAVTVVERARRYGGHALSVKSERGASADPGFGSFTGGAYPNLLKLLKKLDLEVEAMGTFKEVVRFFSHDQQIDYPRIEDLPRHRHVLEEAARFDVWEILEDERYDYVTARDYFAHKGFSEEFIHHYFLGGVIFVFVGHPADYYLDYPIRQLVLSSYLPVLVSSREPVLKVKGGSGAYIRRFAQHLTDLGVRLMNLTQTTCVHRDRREVRIAFTQSDRAWEETFDHLILAAPPHGALEALGETADADEREILSAFPTTRDTAVIHHDAAFMPARRPWTHANVIVPDVGERCDRSRAYHFTKAAVCNEDQRTDVFVTYAYNRDLGIEGARKVTLDHVKVTPEVVRLRRRIQARQGEHNTWFAGSWLRAFTLHEDAVVTGLGAANAILAGLDEHPVVVPHDFTGGSRLMPWGEDQTLLDVIAYRASAHGGRVAFTFVGDDGVSEEHLSFRDLYQRAQALAAHLSPRGDAGPDDRVLLVYPPGLDFIVAFLGAMLAGAVPVPIYPPDPTNLKYDLSKIQALVDVSGARLALTTRGYQRLTRVGSLLSPLSLFKWPRGLKWLTTDALPADPPGPPPRLTRRREDLAFLQFTSGSTADPKGVMISHGNVMHQVSTSCEGLGFSEETVGACWVPQYHDLGLVGGVLNAMYCGARYCFTSPLTFLKRPAVWGEMIHRYKATATSAPDFGYRLLLRRTTAEERAGWDFSHLQVVMSAGEPVRYDTLRDFTRAFEPSGLSPRAFKPAYGLAEHVVAVSTGGTRLFHLDKAELQLHHRVRFGGHRVVGCGSPHPSVEVVIVDPRTQTRAAPDAVGEIWVRSGSKALGYWGRPEETARVFDAHLSGEDGAWLRTGDLGFMHHGEVFVTGRLKDLIILRGRNVYPADVEKTAEGATTLLRPGCAAAFAVGQADEGDERLILLAEAREKVSRKDAEAAAAEVRRAVLRSEGVHLHEVVLLKPKTLPKTTSGKVRRSTCAQLYLRGELAALHRVTGAHEDAVDPGPRLQAAGSLTDLLRAAIFEVTRVEVTDDDRLEDQLSLDSVEFLELVGVIKERLRVDLPVTVLTEHPTLTALSAYIETLPDLRLPDPHLVSLTPSRPGDLTLFLVHPARGGVECYLELARRWPGPLTGIRQRGDAGSVEELAAAYVKAVRSAQPEGPWLLGGFSFGATIALAMARQLEDQGGSVAGVVALDEIHGPPAELIASPWGPELGMLLTLAEELLPAEDLRRLSASIEAARGAVTLDAALASIEDLQIQGALARELHAWRRNLRLLDEHHPGARFTGPAVLLRAKGGVNRDTPLFTRVMEVGGTHFTLLRRPWVDALVPQLQEAINTCLAAGHPPPGETRLATHR